MRSAYAHGIAFVRSIAVIDRRSANLPRRRIGQRCSREPETAAAAQQHLSVLPLPTTAYQRCAALAQRWRSEFCSQQRCTARAAIS